MNLSDMSYDDLEKLQKKLAKKLAGMKVEADKANALKKTEAQKAKEAFVVSDECKELEQRIADLQREISNFPPIMVRVNVPVEITFLPEFQCATTLRGAMGQLPSSDDESLHNYVVDLRAALKIDQSTPEMPQDMKDSFEDNIQYALDDCKTKDYEAFLANNGWQWQQLKEKLKTLISTPAFRKAKELKVLGTSGWYEDSPEEDEDDDGEEDF